MRLSTRMHGVLDYLTAAFLLTLPWTLAEGDPAAPHAAVALAAGAAVLLYSLITDYELGVVRKLQMPVHLWLDGIFGLVLIGSPWVLAFDQDMWVPHVAVGAIALIAAFLTRTFPSYDRRRRA